ncbi:MAG: NACHT domain-containing protein [Spirulinaceae cyanobacterium]
MSQNLKEFNHQVQNNPYDTKSGYNKTARESSPKFLKSLLPAPSPLSKITCASQHRSSMTSPLEERLKSARHHYFVGRAGELAKFTEAITKPQLPFHILHIFGPGGIGKTTLLREFILICQQSQIQSFYLDTRNLEATPESFLKGLGFVMKLPPLESPLQTLADNPNHQVILLDTYETLTSLDEWLREVFLPQLPEEVLLITSSRHSPSTPWYTDPGWQSVTQFLPLRNFSPEESYLYLAKNKLPETQYPQILDFTHGHPLALSLVADVLTQGQKLSWQPEAMPDVIKALLEKFVQEVPSQTHRQALEACTLVRSLTETLLAKMLEKPDSHELFTWLRSLSFIEPAPVGLFPHDLVRDVLVADLRWRNPDWYSELHQRARNYYTTGLGETQGQEQHRLLFDYIFLHRDNPAVKPRFTWQENSDLTTDSLKEGDREALLGIVDQYEGCESAQIAAHWLKLQPEGVRVFRDQKQQLAGLMMTVALHEAKDEDLKADPATYKAWKYLQKNAPLRSGEGAAFFRFWMAQDSYQGVSAVQSLIFINFIQYHRHAPGLAFSFFPCAEADYWAAMFAYADLTRIAEADFEIAKQCYGVYGHDWRVLPPKAWQKLLAQREIAASAQAISPSQVSQPLVFLSEAEFREAVWNALRCFTSPNDLNNNPLLQSQLVRREAIPEAEEAEYIAILQSLVKDAAMSLLSSPRQAKYYRALDHTYFDPAPSQEKAAELLDIPFSTFRRHLKNGVRKVADVLWQQEISPHSRI